MQRIVWLTYSSATLSPFDKLNSLAFDVMKYSAFEDYFSLTVYPF